MKIVKFTSVGIASQDATPEEIQALAAIGDIRAKRELLKQDLEQGGLTLPQMKAAFLAWLS